MSKVHISHRPIAAAVTGPQKDGRSGTGLHIMVGSTNGEYVTQADADWVAKVLNDADPVADKWEGTAAND